MKKIVRFGVSLEEDLLKELDSLIAKHDYPNRSRAIRHLIRKNLIEDAWKENKEVAGCIVLIYDHHKRELVNKSLQVQHAFGELVLASQHVHLDHHNCLEMIALRGKAKQSQKLADTLISIKGIKHGKLLMSGI